MKGRAAKSAPTHGRFCPQGRLCPVGTEIRATPVLPNARLLPAVPNDSGVKTLLRPGTAAHDGRPSLLPGLARQPVMEQSARYSLPKRGRHVDPCHSDRCPGAWGSRERTSRTSSLFSRGADAVQPTPAAAVQRRPSGWTTPPRPRAPPPPDQTPAPVNIVAPLLPLPAPPAGPGRAGRRGRRPAAALVPHEGSAGHLPRHAAGRQ